MMREQRPKEIDVKNLKISLRRISPLAHLHRPFWLAFPLPPRRGEGGIITVLCFPHSSCTSRPERGMKGVKLPRGP